MSRGLLSVLPEAPIAVALLQPHAAYAYNGIGAGQRRKAHDVEARATQSRSTAAVYNLRCG